MRDLTHKGLPELVLGLDLVHEDAIVPVHADEGVDKVVRLIGDFKLHLKVDDFVLVIEEL